MTCLLFKCRLTSCTGCGSWSQLLPADGKGWLLGLYVTTLLQGSLRHFTVFYLPCCLSLTPSHAGKDKKIERVSICSQVTFTGTLANMLLNSSFPGTSVFHETAWQSRDLKLKLMVLLFSNVDNAHKAGHFKSCISKSAFKSLFF